MKITSLGIILSSLLLAAEGYGACNVTTTAVNFGNYNVFSTIPTDSTGTITILCDALTIVRTSIGQSPNSGVFNPRQMKHSSLGDLMNYNLYTDSAMTVIWGDGAGGTSRVTALARRNRPRNLIVYGRIPPGQDISGGLYGETLTVTIVW